MLRQASTGYLGNAESNWTASDDDHVFVGSCTTGKGVALAVLDASDVSQNDLIIYAENFFSVPEIINHLSFLPRAVRALEPSHDSVEKVKRFASKTGDLTRLSHVDLKLIALTYTLESVMYGAKHLTADMNCRPKQESWMLTSLSESSIACVTTNFAMQNVILKMGLRLVAPEPIMQMYEMRRFVLNCKACTSFTEEIGWTSCGNCGNEVILCKVAVTVVPESKEKENIQTLNQRCKMPQDLLDLIVEKLYYTDRIRFRKVCKDWCIPIGTRMDNELPWIICYKASNPYSNSPTTSGISRLILSDPIYKKIHKILDSGGRHSKLLSNSKISGTKRGWLIFKENNTEDCLRIFLYNPFNGNLFRLPTLTFGRKTKINQTLFSSTNPTSPDCAFVVIHAGIDCLGFRVLGISTCRNGDNNWKTKIIDGGGYEITTFQSLCTSEGVCYIVFGDGRLASIYLENQEWNWLVKESPCWKTPHMILHLVEYNGGLLTVRHCYDFGICEVYRFEFDEKERGWIEVKSLGNRAVFLGFSGSCVRSTFGDTADLAGTILRIPLRGNYTQVTAYSLRDENFLENVGAYDWMEIPDLGRKIWIEPPYA